jgi:hypothetical protein
MRASSAAYPQAKRYERTSAIIDHGNGKSYVADFFFVEGGSTQDYIFHGPSQQFAADSVEPSSTHLYDLSNIRHIGQRVTWKLDDNSEFIAHALPGADEQVFLGDGWGQRDPFNGDRGATLPYIVRRQTGPGLKRFASVFVAGPLIQNFTRHDLPDGVELRVETDRATDYIVCRDGSFTVTSKSGSNTDWSFSDGQ